MRRAQFVGAMAHPLNRPRYDEALQRVTRLRHPAAARRRQPARHQPLALCAAVRRRSRHRPLHARGLRCLPGLFGEGSFIGKGIYDVDAFERALKDRFPENRILSHDLLEGCYARAGLLSDVQLYEDYPSRYSADVSRRHRWIRGDWQMPAGCCRAFRVPAAARQNNPLSALSQWKLSTTCAAASSRGLMLLLAAGLDAARHPVAAGPWPCSASCCVPLLCLAS